MKSSIRTCKVLVIILALLIFPLKSYSQRNLYSLAKSLLTFNKRDSLSYSYYNDMINIFSMAYPQEKVYLHFDNTGYFIGENIRFKAYAVDCTLDSLSTLSSVLYVELVSPGGEILEKRKIKLKDGLGHGDISLDKILTSGFYEVRAYTQWMTNWKGDVCFSRVFPIFRRPEKEGDFSQKIIDKYSGVWRLPDYRGTKEVPLFASPVTVTFYPEGGTLVDDIESTVAFSVGGKIFEDSIKGAVISDSGDTITEVKCGPNGRGIFKITPPCSKMRLVLSEGKRAGYPLPESISDGCVLSVDAVNGDNISCEISCTSEWHGKTVGMNVMHDGCIIGSGVYRLGKKPCKFTLARQDMPEGVSDIIIYNRHGKILASRMFFILHQPTRNDSIIISTNSLSLSPCAPISLDIEARPETEFSLSAVDVSTMGNGIPYGVKSWLLLSSDIKGYIHNADYYVESDDLEHRKASDLLMLVQGWRRYDWRMMAGEDTFRIQQPMEHGLVLSGRATPIGNEKTTDGINLRAVLYNSTGQHLDGGCTLDSSGYFTFHLPEIYDDWALVFNTERNGGKADCQIQVDRGAVPPMRILSPEELVPYDIPKGNINIVWRDDSITRGNDTVFALPNVKVEGHRIYENARAAWEDEKVGRNTASLFYDCLYEADRIIDNGNNMPTLQSWLKNRNEFFEGAPYIKHEILTHDEESSSRTANGFSDMNEQSVIILDEHSDNTFSNSSDIDTPENVFDSKYRVYLDGMSYKGRPIIWVVDNHYCCITGFKELNRNRRERFRVIHDFMYSRAVTIPEYLNDAKSVYISEDVDVFKHLFMVQGLDQLRPVTVFVYTNHNGYSNQKGVRRTYYNGYNAPETFKMEDYSVLPPMEDFRRTIFWAPSVKTDKDGHATVEFYNNSTCREMYISAEGITIDGRAISN